MHFGHQKVTLDRFLEGRFDPEAHPIRAPFMRDGDRTDEDRALDHFVLDMQRIAARTPCGAAVGPSSRFTTAEDMVTWFGAAVDEIAATFERKRVIEQEYERLQNDVRAMRRVLLGEHKMVPPAFERTRDIAPSAGGQG